MEPIGECDCGHPDSHHFSTIDEIGYWAFCCFDSCNCFKDIRDENGEDT